jgi:hypothetical protein
MNMFIQEPDYTLTIIEEGGGFVVCEGGKSISKPFEDRHQAEQWLRFHQKWYQPTCCGCGSAISRPDDPWEAVQASSSGGADWMHASCLQKFRAELETNTWS